MNCPNCSEAVDDGTAICPHCDHVLDAGAFSAEPPGADDVGDIGPAKPRPSTGGKKVVKKGSSGARPVVKKSAKASDASIPISRRMPEAPPRLLKPDPKDVKEEIDWRAMSKAAANAPRAAPNLGPPKMVDPEEFLTDTKSFFKELNKADKLAFGGAVATVASSFFPWRETFDQGDSLGLMSLGAPVFVAALAVVGAMVVRVKNLAPKMHMMVPWLAQFGSACFCVLWCLVFIKVAWDPTRTRSPEGNHEMWASSPSIGVVLALVFSIVAVGGSLLGLKAKPTR